MTDIVERLRRGATNGVLIPCEDLVKAADIIEQYRADSTRDELTIANLVRDLAASHGSAGGEQPRDLNFFGENVDCWGALEWFNRLAKAIREQDVAVCANDDIVMEVCRNVASSSAMRLVRDYEKQVRDALSRPSTGVEADTSLQNPQTSPAEVVKQHLAWLFQYVQGMNAGNWHDMKMRAERQLEQLSLMLKEPGDSAQASPDRQLYELSDEEYDAFTKALGAGKPPTQKLIDLMRGYSETQKYPTQAPLPFLCPRCGARGTTDGKASTVSSATRGSGAAMIDNMTPEQLANWTDDGDCNAGAVALPRHIWPAGCHDPDSCARHFGCMYIQCPNMKKDGNDLAAEIRASVISSTTCGGAAK